MALARTTPIDKGANELFYRGLVPEGEDINGMPRYCVYCQRLGGVERHRLSLSKSLPAANLSRDLQQQQRQLEMDLAVNATIIQQHSSVVQAACAAGTTAVAGMYRGWAVGIHRLFCDTELRSKYGSEIEHQQDEEARGRGGPL